MHAVSISETVFYAVTNTSLTLATLANGDIRPSSFHWQEADDTVRFAHFGQRAMCVPVYDFSLKLLTSSIQPFGHLRG